MRRVVPVLCVVLAACGETATEARSSGGSETAAKAAAVISSPVEIADHVVVLSGNAAKNAIVDENTVTVLSNDAPRTLSQIAPGDYLVSGEGDGFLRQVVGVEAGDSLRFSTIEAKLSDIVISGALHATLELDPLVLDLSGQAKIGTEALGVEITPFLMQVTPTVQLDIEIVKGEVKLFSTEVRFERSTSIGLSAQAVAPQSFDTGDFTLWTSPKWRFVQTIGPIPIVEIVSVTVATGLRGEISAQASAIVEGSCDRTQTYRMDYENGEWRSDSRGDTTCSPIEPTFGASFGHIELETYLKGTLNVNFYGLLGPYLSLSDGLLASMNVCPSPARLALDSPARLAIGADLKKIGGKKYEATIAAAAFPIGRWSVDTSSICF